MKLTPRQWQRFFFVFFNLMLGAGLIIPLALTPDAVGLLFGAPPFVLVLLFPVLLIVIVNIALVRQIRSNKRRRAPRCPVCSSEDVSFGGEVSHVAFSESTLSNRLIIMSGLGALVLLLATSDVLPQSWLDPYLFAIAIAGVGVQISSQVLHLRYSKRARALSDERIRWVCETCKNEWEGLEHPDENVAAAPAPLIR